MLTETHGTIPEVSLVLSPYFEDRSFPQPNIPIAYHENELGRNNMIYPHWHSALEILCFREGITAVNYNNKSINASLGDAVIINSNAVHSFKSVTDRCLYDCLIIDSSWLQSLDIEIENIYFPDLLRDSALNEHFLKVKNAYLQSTQFRKLWVQLETLSFVSYLLTNLPLVDDTSYINQFSTQTILVKRIIKYIRDHLNESISIDDICREVNFSKSYVCRTFQKHTGRTIVELINSMRCSQAQKYLSNHIYNVSECAQICGFSNLSYFTKIYKNI